MLLRLLSGQDILQAFIYMLSGLFVIFFVLPFHEYAHGYVAYKLGDNTAKYQGRLSLNPFSHLDLIGALMIILVGFGWAKPVPINHYNFKNPKAGMALTALAGPVANIIMGTLSLILGNAILLILKDSTGPFFVTVIPYLYYFFSFVASINFSLAVFNLLPIPPLDGSKILAACLPDRLYNKFFMYEKYLYIILIILVFSGGLSGFLGTIQSALYTSINSVIRLIFGL